jgi:hypothetical protein
MRIRGVGPGLHCKGCRKKIRNSMFVRQSRHVDDRMVHDLTIISWADTVTRGIRNENPWVFRWPERYVRKVCGIMLG